MNWTRIELQHLVEFIQHLPDKQKEMGDDTWLTAYHIALQFAECCDAASRREREMAQILKQGTLHQWTEAVERAALHPPLDWLAGGLKGLTVEQVKEWNAWCRRMVLPVSDFAPDVIALGPRLDTFREKLAAARKANPKLGQQDQSAHESLRGELDRFQDCNEKRRYDFAAKHLEAAINAMVRLSFLDPQPAERERARKQASEKFEEAMPKAVAKHFQTLTEASKMDEALDWLEQAAKRGVGLVAPVFEESVRAKFEQWRAQKNQEDFKRCEKEALEEVETPRDGLPLRETARTEAVTQQHFHKIARPLSRAAQYPLLAQASGIFSNVRRRLTDRWKSFQKLHGFLRAHEHVMAESDKASAGGLKTLSTPDLARLCADLGELDQQARNLGASVGLLDSEATDALLDAKARTRLEEVRTKFLRSARGDLQRRIAAARLKAIFLATTSVLMIGAAALTIKGYLDAERNAEEVRKGIVSNHALSVESFLAERSQENWIFKAYQYFPKWKEAQMEAESWLEVQHQIEENIAVKVKDLSGREQRQYADVDLKETDELVAALKLKLTPSAEGDGTAKKSRFNPGAGGWEPEITVLADDLGVQSRPDFERVTKSWEKFLVDTAAEIERSIKGALDQTEKTLTDLSTDRKSGTISRLSTALDPLLAALNDAVKKENPPLERLRPPKSLSGQLATARSSATQLMDKVKSSQGYLASLATAADITGYVKALSNVSKVPDEVWNYLPSGSKEAAKKVEQHFGQNPDFSAWVLGIQKPSSSGSGAGTPVPSGLSNSEKDVLLDLRDDWKLSRIVPYRLSNNTNIYAKGELEMLEKRVIGDLTKCREGGLVYVPDSADAKISFQQKEFTYTKNSKNTAVEGVQPRPVVTSPGSLPPECVFFLSLGLDKAFTLGTAPRYNVSLVVMLDNVIRAPVSPTFKAHLHVQLGKVLMERANEWGLQLTTFQEDYDQLLSMAAKVDSSSWLLSQTQRNNLESKLIQFYKDLAKTSYSRQYQDAVKVVAASASDFMRFSGYSDLDGSPRLIPPSAPPAANTPFWGVNSPGSQGILKHARQKAPDSPDKLLAFSPLFTPGVGYQTLRNAVQQNPVLSRVFGSLAE